MVNERALDMAVRRFPMLLDKFRKLGLRSVTHEAWVMERIERYMLQIVAEYRYVVWKEMQVR